MKPAFLMVLVLFAGCAQPEVSVPLIGEVTFRPATDPPVYGPPFRLVGSARVPVDLRQPNYTKEGSCWHAATITMLRWHGKHETAKWWGRNYSGGADVDVVAAGLRKRDVAYRLETGGDPEFLEWVSRTRRVAAIQFQGGGSGRKKWGHATNFVGFRDGKAIIIDNNHPWVNNTVPKKQFIKQWQRHGGNAIALRDLPPPPKPWR